MNWKDWQPDLMLIEEEALLRKLEEEHKALQAKHTEWSTTLSVPQEKIGPASIAAYLTALEIMADHLKTYLPRVEQLHHAGYSRADELLGRLFFTLMAFQTHLHRWYRTALWEQTKDEVEKIRSEVYKGSQNIQEGIKRRWRADFFRTCIYCEYWLGDAYPSLKICPSCGRFLHQ